jgi:hypothetical protein
MTTVPITITLNLPLETVEKYLPKILEESNSDIDDIVKSYKTNQFESMMSNFNLPNEAKNRIRKIKEDYDNGRQPDMNEVFSLMSEYKEEFKNVDINQVLSLFKKEEKEEEKKAEPAFDLSQIMNSVGPMLNQFANQNRGRGKRRR